MAQQPEQRVSHPNIISSLYKHERKTSLALCQAYPDLAIHHEAMMEIYNLLPKTAIPGIHPNIFFATFPSQTVQPEEIAIAGLDDVFFSIIAIQCT